MNSAAGRPVDVAIVGAGIAGLALAIALARAGIRVAILDGREPLPVQANWSDTALNNWDHRVSALTPGSSSLLSNLGVWPQVVDQRVAPYVDMRVWDADGTGEIAFSAAASGLAKLGHIVENRVTVAALAGVLASAGSVDTYWSQTLESIDRQADDQLRLKTHEGLAVDAPLIVGADGARSSVRELAGFETRSWSYDQHAIVATVALAEPHRQTCYQAFLTSGPLAFLPLADPHLCSIVWSLDDEAWAELDGADDEALIRGLNRAAGVQVPAVTAVASRASFPLKQCHATDYVKPGLALVADAAHSIHPLAGQGINLGLKDVAVLSEVLVEGFQQGLDLGDVQVLRRYQRQRKADNLAMMAAMEAFKRGFGSDNPFIRVARNAGLTWVDGFGPLKNWLAAKALA